ncbi:MAG: HD domain-containing protein [Candidatus Wallbacteria bacterium]|nr:HD domain-containing protein [Candidatus Wallbacteria bacterium]
MFINDSIHGLMKLSELQKDLLVLPEVQRLQWIRQLGLSFLCYPGAVHTRISHSLGVSYLAGRIARHLDLPQKDIELVEAAGLLHDIGHTPFSHTLESMLEKGHMEISREMVTGARVIPMEGAGKIPEILEKHQLDPVRIGELITNRYRGSEPLQQIIFGDFDADQLDYLVRDSYFCGIAHGRIDIYRIIYTMALSDDGSRLFLREKGIEAIEEMLVAREHMYSSVYTHKTSRSAELMLLSAVRKAGARLGAFDSMVDAQLFSALENATPLGRDTVSRLLTRRLFKMAYALYNQPDLRSRLQAVSQKYSESDLEKIIAERAGISADQVIVDMPVEALKLGEPRLKKINITVLTKEMQEKPLQEVSTLIRSLLEKEGTNVILGVYCVPEKRKEVREAALEVLKSDSV